MAGMGYPAAKRGMRVETTCGNILTLQLPVKNWEFPMPGPARNTHGTTVRGLNLPRGSKFFGGQFGRMFRSLPPADYGATDSETEVNLLKLGLAMVAPRDGAKDGPDPEESGIPAAYTYLGQFID